MPIPKRRDRRDIVGAADADRAGGFRGFEDLVAVGRDRDDVDAARGDRLHDGPGNQRLAAQVDQVLVRIALGAPACGDDGQRPPGRKACHIRPSRRSSAVQKPSPMFLWPCQISGMKEAPGACLRRTADFVEVDFAFADLQAFTVKALGVAEVQMGGMGAETREAFGEIEAEMIGGKLGVGDVDAHPQIMPGAERGRLRPGK